MDADGLGEDRAHRAYRHPSDQPRRGAGLCTRPCVRPAAGTRRVPYDRWRRDVDPRALRGREHRMLRSRDGRQQSACPLRRHVADRDPHLGPHQRWAGQRPVRVTRRWRHLDQAARERSADQAARQGGARYVAVQLAACLRDDRDRRWCAVERTGDRERPAVALRGWRAELGTRLARSQRHGPRALLLAHGRGAGRRGRGLLPHRLLREVDRRRTHTERDAARAGPGGRPPRHVDRSHRCRPTDRRARPGTLHHAEPRQDLVPAAVEQRADLPRHGRQQHPVQRARQQAGRADVSRAEQLAAGGRSDPARDVARGGWR